jgi:hypothetical protein
MRPFLPSLLLAVSAACTSFEDVDLRPLLEKQHFPIVQGPVPPGGETVGLIAVENSGFYLFGLVALCAVSFEECVDVMITRGRKLGADGIAEVRMTYNPASFLHFSGVWPDWFAYVQLTGTAWRRPGGAVPPQ